MSRLHGRTECYIKLNPVRYLGPRLKGTIQCRRALKFPYVSKHTKPIEAREL